MKIAYLTRIKDEEDLIYQNLIYHYNMGVDAFFVTFNNSNQKTIDLVEKFVTKYKVAYFPYYESDTSYMQAEQFNKMSQDAFERGFSWILPLDADELLVLKNITLKELIEKYDHKDFGYINFRWIDHFTTKKDKEDSNYFTKWKYRNEKPRGPSKIIVKWHLETKFGDGHHLIITKRDKFAEIPIETGYYAHFPNRSLEQIKAKRIRIGEAFLEKYGESSGKPQIKEYKRWKLEGDSYFDNVWSELCQKREKNFKDFVYDPIPENLFKEIEDEKI